MTNQEKITGIILAGGNSSRMGSDKALILFKGRRLIEYGIGILKEFCNNILISTHNDALGEFGFQLVSDNFTDIGPLAGLEAGLRKSETRINIIAPCDTPFLSCSMLKKLIDNSEKYDATIPAHKNGKIEPLIGYYSRDILPVILNQIEKGDYKIQNLLKQINTSYLPFEDESMFMNLNSPVDIEKSKQKKQQPDILPFRNILLIAGSGRNVGKTKLACEIITYFSKKQNVIGVKISQHSHPVGAGQKIIASGDEFTVVEEMLESSKDSSRMKQAGAKKVFYIQTIPEKLSDAINSIRNEISTGPVVCESGGLCKIIDPGVFIFVQEDTIPENKKHYLSHNPVAVKSLNGIPEFDIYNLSYSHNGFTMKK
ncbi:MAG: molybdenum cofactor guanylyltransferase [Lentimicrobium sp.]|nr:molybdenum cofactor guanylyltransferase [Lentimicrobium sp.]